MRGGAEDLHPVVTIDDDSHVDHGWRLRHLVLDGDGEILPCHELISLNLLSVSTEPNVRDPREDPWSLVRDPHRRFCDLPLTQVVLISPYHSRRVTGLGNPAIVQPEDLIGDQPNLIQAVRTKEDCLPRLPERLDPVDTPLLEILISNGERFVHD